MPRQRDTNIYSNMDRSTLNTLRIAEVQAWAIETRLKTDGEYMLQVIRELPYDENFGIALSAIVADLKASWRAQCKPITERWAMHDEEIVIQNAIKSNKAVEKRLGRGAFSSVFLMKDRRVLKINCNKTVYDPWLSYAEEIMKSDGTNPFFPRLYELHRFGTSYVALMERLEPWTKEKMEYGVFNSLETHIMEYPQVAYNRIGSASRGNFDQFQEVSDTIKRVVQGSFKARVDLHSDNAMFRDNQLVITDPIAWGNTPEAFKMFHEAAKPVPPVEEVKKKLSDIAKDFRHPRPEDFFWNMPMIKNGNRAIDRILQIDRLPKWNSRLWLRSNGFDRRIKMVSNVPELPLIKVKRDGDRFGLKYENAKCAKNHRQSKPKPWYRALEDNHLDMYNMLLAGMDKEYFAVGEPQVRHSMKILKGRKEVDAQGAQAP